MNTIAEQFESYRKDVIPVDASETQVKETRLAFYAGAAAIMAILIGLEKQNLSDDQLEPEILSLTLELKVFSDSVKEIEGAQI